MTSEQDFIKSVKDYFNNPELIDDKAERRLLFLLGKYKENIEVKVVEREVERRIEIIRYKPIYIGKGNGRPEVPPCSPSQLEQEGISFCQEHGIEYPSFRKSEKMKAGSVVTAYRRMFCEYIRGKYAVSNNELADYFYITHASICNYLHPKKTYIKKSKFPGQLSKAV